MRIDREMFHKWREEANEDTELRRLDEEDPSCARVCKNNPTR